MKRSTPFETARDLGLFVLSSYLLTAVGVADVKLPRVFGNHMVLQRGVPLPIWGWANPGEAIRVTLADQTVETHAGQDGRWTAKLPALPAGGPSELTIRGTNEVRLTDILIGEVWLCSGQSNMEMGVGMVTNADAEIAAADYPQVRLFEVPRNPAAVPADDVNPTAWRACGPKTVADGWWGGFSAVAYFFGRHLHNELDVPVGLISSSWGGTRIEPWTPPCGFAAVPSLQHYATDIERKDTEFRTKVLPEKVSEIERWIAATRAALKAGDALPREPAWPHHPLANEWSPTGLYNGMIHPLAPFAIRGAIWYQGESNVDPCDGMAYCEKMKALVSGWRKVWGQGDFPFYYVQLAPFKYTLHRREITTDQLPRIWEAQLAALEIPNTGMAVTTDLGDWRDIHPKNKQDVGRRLALWALAKTYNRTDVVCSGPLYKSMSVEEDRVRIRFDHVDGGLATRDDQPPNWFEIAGADRQFVQAQARIDGETVVVWSEQVPEPAAVRFAWHMLPEPLPNLINKAGLPASPFRTHPW